MSCEIESECEVASLASNGPFNWVADFGWDRG